MKKICYICIFVFVISLIGIFCFFTQKETVAIIGAMDAEINEYIKNISHPKNKQYCDFEVTAGNLGKYRLIISKSGVGKVNSSVTAQYIIDKYHPKYIINTGIAGALSPDLKAGDIIIAQKMVQHDFDVTAFGNPKGYMDNGIEPDKPTFYYSDKDLINYFIEKSKNKNLKTGTIATGDIFVADKNTKNAIKKEFGANLVDMESAAIAQVAQKNNIPVIVLRTVSDEIQDTTKEYKQNKQKAALQPALAVVQVLKSGN